MPFHEKILIVLEAFVYMLLCQSTWVNWLMFGVLASILGILVVFEQLGTIPPPRTTWAPIETSGVWLDNSHGDFDIGEITRRQGDAVE